MSLWPIRQLRRRSTRHFRAKSVPLALHILGCSGPGSIYFETKRHHLTGPAGANSIAGQSPPTSFFLVQAVTAVKSGSKTWSFRKAQLRTLGLDCHCSRHTLPLPLGVELWSVQGDFLPLLLHLTYLSRTCLYLPIICAKHRY